VQTCLGEGSLKAPREYMEMSALLRPVVHQLSRNVPYMKRIQALLSLPTGPVPDVTSPGDPAPKPLRPKQRHERHSRDGSAHFGFTVPMMMPMEAGAMMSAAGPSYAYSPLPPHVLAPRPPLPPLGAPGMALMPPPPLAAARGPISPYAPYYLAARGGAVYAPTAAASPLQPPQ